MTVKSVPTSALLDGFDLTDLDNFAHGFPHDAFTRHRRVAPVLWHDATPHTPDGDGFWSVATYAETLAVARDPVTYSSERGGHRARAGTILPDQAIAGEVLNMMDDPRHGRIRRLVSVGLTPKAVTDLEANLREHLRAVVDQVDGEDCDAVLLVRELPLHAIALLMGVPAADRHQLAEWVDHTFDFKDRGYLEATEEVSAAQRAMFDYGTELIAEKRRHPGDDMLSVAANARLDAEDPPQLTDGELQLFFSLLFSAGAETTRSAAAGGLLALAARPDQWRRLRDDPTLHTRAVEEIVRWTSPAAYNRRTATCATELAGMAIQPGDKVVFWEASANRDERVFAESMSFDVSRDPNPHLGFGHGLHFCLGANLARLELRVTLEELATRVERLEPAGTPEWTRSNKHTGLRHVPLRVHWAATRS
ncbi:MAG TPA: cytochrome P450 [Acidimicrobiia bacterium]|nr:cytochrome P450 [Acidimicrobiia bacterium]